ncbi:kinesin-like protein KIF6 [Brachionichthys hirsutus]|uniref:kinesin-like protein KIF6 n=1 Tax=Brachionichthys hirsutus TaxID=412623 RepID=UPI0036045F7E
MVKQTIEIFARIRPTKAPAAAYSVVSEEQIGASLEFTVPRDLDDGFVNNKRERYKFRFQKIFDQAAEQEEIFENIAKPVADRRAVERPSPSQEGRSATTTEASFRAHSPTCTRT